jgi:hypothetical protein
MPSAMATPSPSAGSALRQLPMWRILISFGAFSHGTGGVAEQRLLLLGADQAEQLPGPRSPPTNLPPSRTAATRCRSSGSTRGRAGCPTRATRRRAASASVPVAGTGPLATARSVRPADGFGSECGAWAQCFRVCDHDLAVPPGRAQRPGMTTNIDPLSECYVRYRRT